MGLDIEEGASRGRKPVQCSASPAGDEGGLGQMGKSESNGSSESWIPDIIGRNSWNMFEESR